MRTILSTLVLFIILNSNAQVGKTFPKINGFDLSEKPVILPPGNGKYTIIAIAYYREAEPEMKKWLNPLFSEFVEKKHEMEMSESYDINFYFVPMISGLKNAKMDYKKNTDKGFWPYVIDTDKYDIKGMQKEIGVETPTIPHFYVLDKAGKIVNIQTGKFTEEKMEQMAAAIK